MAIEIVVSIIGGCFLLLVALSQSAGMKAGYLIGCVILVIVVAWGCSGCSDGERVNCVRVKNKAVTMTSDMQIGGGRCA